MEAVYIKVPAVYKKIKDAENEKRVIYISGAVGYGKTAAVEYYYRRKSYLLLSGVEGYLDEMPNPQNLKAEVVIFDDTSWLTDEKSKKYIIDMISREEKQIIIIGRSRIPSWLRVVSMEKHFIFADERDLTWSKKEAAKLFEIRGIQTAKEEFDQVVKMCMGHPLAYIYTAYRMESGIHYSESITAEVWLDLYHYFDHACYEKWDNEMREVLLALCQYDTFTVEMAEMISGNNQVPVLFERAMNVGTFLEKKDAENYVYRYALREYFKWKQAIIYTKKQMRENYERAALYYEIHDQIEQALKYYNLGENQEKISNLLIKNAEKHPGTGHFFETREYYYSLPEETILASPVLISGMCMLYSITLQPEKSREWYEKLQEFERNCEKGNPKKKEAGIRLAYLDIALPHSGIHGIIEIFKKTAFLCMNKNIKLPEFSVTSNLPSIMNGGLDFCEWTRNDKELAVLLKKPIELVLGKHGVGLINIALAESGFEKGTMETYDIITRLNTGYMMSDAGGKIEMCFAATGLLCKEHMAQGQTVIAEKLIRSFREKVVREGANQILPNLDTMIMWIKLMKGDVEVATRWMETAPEENIAFCILDRYKYINKVRCHIALGQPEAAINLVERLNVYFIEYDRHYLWMENQILKAVILYRMHNEGWKSVLAEVLKKGERYHFIRVFAQEGIALKELLDQIEEEMQSAVENEDVLEDPLKEVDGSYLKEVKEAINKMAIYYPNYLKEKKLLEEPLTEMEESILRLLCEGISSAEICNLFCITTSGLKFHNRNIYRKLGVKSRREAEREAARLGLDR